VLFYRGTPSTRGDRDADNEADDRANASANRLTDDQF
jgi:hypothetical protein